MRIASPDRIQTRTRISLSALDEAVPFYEHFGFTDMTCTFAGQVIFVPPCIEICKRILNITAQKECSNEMISISSGDDLDDDKHIQTLLDSRNQADQSPCFRGWVVTPSEPPVITEPP